MNQPKGEESTRTGDSCSSCTTCPHRFCSAAEPSPGKLRPGRTNSKGRALCGGFRPSPFRKDESRAAGFVRWTERDPPDRADRDDELVRVTVRLTHGQRQETVARLAGETLEREPLPVGELHLNMCPLGGVSRGVALDLTVDTVDESLE